MMQAGLLTREPNKPAKDEEAARDALYKRFLDAAEPIAQELIAHRYGYRGNLGRVTDRHVTKAAIITVACFAAAADCDLNGELSPLEVHTLATTALNRARRAEALASLKPAEPVY